MLHPAQQGGQLGFVDGLWIDVVVGGKIGHLAHRQRIAAADALAGLVEGGNELFDRCYIFGSDVPVFSDVEFGGEKSGSGS